MLSTAKIKTLKTLKIVKFDKQYVKDPRTL